MNDHVNIARLSFLGEIEKIEEFHKKANLLSSAAGFLKGRAKSLRAPIKGSNLYKDTTGLLTPQKVGQRDIKQWLSTGNTSNLNLPEGFSGNLGIKIGDEPVALDAFMEQFKSSGKSIDDFLTSKGLEAGSMPSIGKMQARRTLDPSKAKDMTWGQMGRHLGSEALGGMANNPEATALGLAGAGALGTYSAFK